MKFRVRLLLIACLSIFPIFGYCQAKSKIQTAVLGDPFAFPTGVMIERGQYEVLYKVQALKDSAIAAYHDRATILNTIHTADRAEISRLESQKRQYDVQLQDLSVKLATTEKRAKTLAVVGVVVGTLTTFLLTR
jgi:hypothetical protein